MLCYSLFQHKELVLGTKVSGKLFSLKVLTYGSAYVILLSWAERKEGSMSPRTGRPTDDPKHESIKIRVSENTLEKLDYCHQRTGLSRAEIIRQGIDKIYSQLKQSESSDTKKD